MVVLLAEISNAFIKMVNQHIDYTSWFNLEPLESAPKIEQASQCAQCPLFLISANQHAVVDFLRHVGKLLAKRERVWSHGERRATRGR